MNKLMMSSGAPFMDYIVLFGQSNINGRTSPSYFDAKYIASDDLIKIYDIDSNSLINFQGNTLLAHYSQTSEPANIAWDSVLLHDLADYYNYSLKIIKVTMGGSGCATGLSWNVPEGGQDWLDLKARIEAFKVYAASLGYQARLRLMLCDLKETDADTEVRALAYCNLTGGLLNGNFVDLVNAIKNTAGNDAPIVHCQIMTTQVDPYATTMVTSQNLFNDNYPKSFLLKMNENTTRYPLADLYHYNSTGVRNVSDDQLDVIINNRLLDNWQ